MTTPHQPRSPVELHTGGNGEMHLPRTQGLMGLGRITTLIEHLAALDRLLGRAESNAAKPQDSAALAQTIAAIEESAPQPTAEAQQYVASTGRTIGLEWTRAVLPHLLATTNAADRVNHIDETLNFFSTLLPFKLTASELENTATTLRALRDTTAPSTIPAELDAYAASQCHAFPHILDVPRDGQSRIAELLGFTARAATSAAHELAARGSVGEFAGDMRRNRAALETLSNSTALHAAPDHVRAILEDLRMSLRSPSVPPSDRREHLGSRTDTATALIWAIAPDTVESRALARPPTRDVPAEIAAALLRATPENDRRLCGIAALFGDCRLQHPEESEYYPFSERPLATLVHCRQHPLRLWAVSVENGHTHPESSLVNLLASSTAPRDHTLQVALHHEFGQFLGRALGSSDPAVVQQAIAALPYLGPELGSATLRAVVDFLRKSPPTCASLTIDLVHAVMEARVGPEVSALSRLETPDLLRALMKVEPYERYTAAVTAELTANDPGHAESAMRVHSALSAVVEFSLTHAPKAPEVYPQLRSFIVEAGAAGINGALLFASAEVENVGLFEIDDLTDLDIAAVQEMIEPTSLVAYLDWVCNEQLTNPAIALSRTALAVVLLAPEMRAEFQSALTRIDAQHEAAEEYLVHARQQATLSFLRTLSENPTGTLRARIDRLSRSLQHQATLGSDDTRPPDTGSGQESKQPFRETTAAEPLAALLGLPTLAGENRAEALVLALRRGQRDTAVSAPPTIDAELRELTRWLPVTWRPTPPQALRDNVASYHPSELVGAVFSHVVKDAGASPCLSARGINHFIRTAVLHADGKIPSRIVSTLARCLPAGLAAQEDLTLYRELERCFGDPDPQRWIEKAIHHALRDSSPTATRAISFDFDRDIRLRASDFATILLAKYISESDDRLNASAALTTRALLTFARPAVPPAPAAPPGPLDKIVADLTLPVATFVRPRDDGRYPISRALHLLATPTTTAEAHAILQLIPRAKEIETNPRIIHEVAAWLAPSHLREPFFRAFAADLTGTPPPSAEALLDSFGDRPGEKSDFAAAVLNLSASSAEPFGDFYNYVTDHTVTEVQLREFLLALVTGEFKDSRQRRELYRSIVRDRLELGAPPELARTFHELYGPVSSSTPTAAQLDEQIGGRTSSVDGAKGLAALLSDALAAEYARLSSHEVPECFLTDAAAAKEAHDRVWVDAAHRFTSAQFVRLGELVGEVPDIPAGLELMTIHPVVKPPAPKKRTNDHAAFKVALQTFADSSLMLGEFHQHWEGTRRAAPHPRHDALAHALTRSIKVASADATSLPTEAIRLVHLVETIGCHIMENASAPTPWRNVTSEGLLRALIIPLAYESLPRQLLHPLVAAGIYPAKDRLSACADVFELVVRDPHILALQAALTPTARAGLLKAFDVAALTTARSGTHRTSPSSEASLIGFPWQQRPQSEANGRAELLVIPARGAALELFGDMTQTCVSREERGIARNYPNVTALYFARHAEGGQIEPLGGTLLALTETETGEKAAVLYSFNPTDKALKKFGVSSLFEEVKQAIVDRMEALGVRYLLLPRDPYPGITLTNRPEVFEYLKRYTLDGRELPLKHDADTAISGLSIRARTVILHDTQSTINPP